MRAVKFKATLLAGHKEAAVEVPFDPGERWGLAPRALRPGRRGHAVQAVVGGAAFEGAAFEGAAFEGAIVARSKRFWLPVPAAVLRAAGLRVGDVAHVSVAPLLADEAPMISDGDACVVLGGTHKGKSGTATDINTSKTGHVTITVVQADGQRFKTLAKNVKVVARGT